MRFHDVFRDMNGKFCASIIFIYKGCVVSTAPSRGLNWDYIKTSWP